MKIVGVLNKMRVVNESPAHYYLRVNEETVDLNPLLGQTIRLAFTGNIFCVHCHRKIKKTFNEGYCFPCSQKLARCDLCIVRPERCHFHLGTCREPEWGLANCMQAHIIYLANTSGMKVGITRQVNIPTRWFDQGATQALPILATDSRYTAGLIEVILAKHIQDKTDWRKMLKGEGEKQDLAEKRDQLLQICADDLASLTGHDFNRIASDVVHEFSYPILQYPSKASSLSFDKVPVIESVLWGVKAQYCIFEQGAINIRKHSGYEIEVEA